MAFVKALQDFSAPDRSRSFRKGDIVELPDDIAEGVVAEGLAVAVNVTEVTPAADAAPGKPSDTAKPDSGISGL